MGDLTGQTVGFTGIQKKHSYTLRCPTAVSVWKQAAHFRRHHG